MTNHNNPADAPLPRPTAADNARAMPQASTTPAKKPYTKPQLEVYRLETPKMLAASGAVACNENSPYVNLGIAPLFLKRADGSTLCSTPVAEWNLYGDDYWAEREKIITEGEFLSCVTGNDMGGPTGCDDVVWYNFDVCYEGTIYHFQDEKVVYN